MRLDYFTVGTLCAKVDLRASRPLIDLSRVTFVETFGLIYLCMFIRHNNNAGILFHVAPPSDLKVLDYLLSRGFWRWVGPQESKAYTHLVTSPTSFNTVVCIQNKRYIAEEIEDWILGNLGIDPTFTIDVPRVAELAVELVDNFHQHSDQQFAACCLQVYPKLKRLDFAIGDCGIGIRESLAQNSGFKHLDSWQHVDAALEAFKDGVTSRIGGGGTGLGTVRENILELGGQMFLSTGNAWVQFGAKILDGFRYGEYENDLPGVQIEVSIPEGASNE